MKVFVSHQKVDSAKASAICLRLKTIHSVDTYLDVVDPEAATTGENLGDHIRSQMTSCDALLAVVSEATKSSWWVPWEIGVATEKSFPLATFAIDYAALPVYLKKWPYLRTDADIDKYAEALKSADRDFRIVKASKAENVARRDASRTFYSTLRKGLGQ